MCREVNCLSNFKISFLNIIIFLLYLYLIIDTVNGIIIRNYNFSVSPIYKITLLILMVIILLKHRVNSPLMSIGIFLIFTSIHFFMNTYSSLEIFWSLKFLIIIVSFYFFKLLILNNMFFVVKRMFFISFFIISFNMIIGYLGYGYSQYEINNIGTRGLFYAGNEVGILLIATSTFILSHLLLNNENKKYIFISISTLILSILLSSKVAVLGSGLVILTLPLINIIQTSNGLIFKKSSFYIVCISTIIFIILIPYAIYYTLFEMNLIVRISYWINKVDYITLFYSGRNLLANDIVQFVKNDSSILNILFGYGYDKIILIAGRTVELDAVDIFMIYGVLGLVIIYGFFFLNLIKNIKKDSKIYIYKPYTQFGILFMLLLSISSGHVINSGLSGIMIGALMSLNYYRVENVFR